MVTPPSACFCSPDCGFSDTDVIRQIQRCGFQTDVDIRCVIDPSPVASVFCSVCCPDVSTAIHEAHTVVTDNTTRAQSLHQRIQAPVSYHLCHLGHDQLRILWHQHLGHLHYRRIRDLHRTADGVPQLATTHELAKCPVCLAAKLKRAARGLAESPPTTTCNQGISIDTGFVVQQSSDSARYARSVGLNGETCYCLITDHHLGTLYGQCFASKRPPIAFLNPKHGCSKDVPNKYVRLDQGGELAGCHAIIGLFEDAGYHIQVTATDTSSSNGRVERPHQTISNALLSMLNGADLLTKFWPYAFHHYLRLYNVTPHADAVLSPMEICTGRQPDLSLLQTFGCRLYALPARPNHKRAEKLHSDTRKGFFLGYAQTFKNVLYFDEVTKTVKICQHVAFDEAMADVPYDRRSPNAKMLQDLSDGVPLDSVDFSTPTVSIDLDECSPIHGAENPYNALRL